MTDWPGLVADIGGTNARFALVQAGERPERIQTWPTTQFPSLEEALAAFLAQEARHLGRERVELSGIAVCAAGPVKDGVIHMTNSPWVVSEAELEAATGVAEPIVVNDFTALAHALPGLAPEDCRPLGGDAPEPGAPIGLIGPGTGLGVSGLIRDRHGDFIALASEGGHVDLAPGDAREIAVLEHLMRDFDHVSAERILSGPGLEGLLAALCALDGRTVQELAASDIAERAAAEDADRHATEAVRLFCGWLGAFAGNLALTLGAKGGVYVGGGIVPKWGDLFDSRLFRERFEAKGRFRGYLQPIPAYLIVAAEPALLGLSRLLQRPERGRL